MCGNFEASLGQWQLLYWDLEGQYLERHLSYHLLAVPPARVLYKCLLSSHEVRSHAPVIIAIAFWLGGDVCWISQSLGMKLC